RTIVNNGFAFCETGVEYRSDASDVGLKTGSRSNAQTGAVQLTSDRQRYDSKSSLCSSIGGATGSRGSIEILRPDSSANQKFSGSDACKQSNQISQSSSERITRPIPRNPPC